MHGQQERVRTIIDSNYLNGHDCTTAPSMSADTTLLGTDGDITTQNAKCTLMFRLGGGSPDHKVQLTREQLLWLTTADVHPISEGSASGIKNLF